MEEKLILTADMTDYEITKALFAWMNGESDDARIRNLAKEINLFLG